jgi:hypothetical protein
LRRAQPSSLYTNNIAVNHNSAHAVQASPQVPKEEETKFRQMALVVDVKDTRV